MRFGIILSVSCAVVLHAGFLLFGGAFFTTGKENHGQLQEVELLSEEKAAEETKPEPDEPEPIESDEEPPPDAEAIMKDLESAPSPEAPALEAASLSAIEAALNAGGAPGGEFADALSFSSGGVIGGTGKAGTIDEQMEKAFSLAEIDQEPRAIFQAAPIYPSELRTRKLEGTVTIKIIIDQSGRVTNARCETSTHPAFEKPALDAVKKWKFEPAIKAGQRVACRRLVPFRFQPS